MKNLLNCYWILFCVLSINSKAQAPLQWSTFHSNSSAPYSGIATESNLDVRILSSGNAISIGETMPLIQGNGSELALRKYRSNDGTVIQTFYLDYFGNGGFNKAKRLIVAEPYIYVVGDCLQQQGGDSQIFILKLDTSLTLIWSRIFNGAGSAQDNVVDLGIDFSGNIYVVGNTERSSSGKDIVLLKYKPNGDNLFTKFYSSAGNFDDMATAMAVEANGICNITGYYSNATYGKRLLALKIWGNGVKLWEKYHDVNTNGAFDDIGTSVTFNPSSGDMFVTGHGFSPGNGMDWVIIKFDGIDGTKSYAKKYNPSGSQDDLGVAITFSNSGDLYACANVYTSLNGNSTRNIQLKKLNPADGSVYFTKTYNYVNNGYSVDVAQHMVVSQNGNVYICGSTDNQSVWPPLSAYEGYHLLVVAYSSTGSLMWSYSAYSGSNSSFATAHRAAFSNSQGSLYVAGQFSYGLMAPVKNSSMHKFSPVSIVEPIDFTARMQENVKQAEVYPIPAKDFLNVYFNEAQNTSAQIIDLHGRTLLSLELNEESNRFDISSLAPGIYLIKYATDDGIGVVRFVKE